MRYLIKALGKKKESEHGTTSYSTFSERHPSYNEQYWEQLDALCSGGVKLLGDDKLMKRVFPKHRDEHDKIYAERLACAHYLPFAGEVVGNIVNGVFSDPMDISGKDGELPDFYKDFIEDTSRPGKRTKCSMSEFAEDMLLTALKKKTAWAQVDLPIVSGTFSNALEEEQSNATRAYVVSISPENVIDWGEDEDGDLTWAIIRKVTNKRESPDSNRNNITEEFSVFDRGGYQIFSITHDKDKPIEEKDPVRLISKGDHSFGQVPLVRLSLVDNLWAMDKMESACRALLRDLNSLEWGVRQSLHSQLYEFLGPETDMMSPIGLDPERANNQQRGDGYVCERAGGDRAEYIGPSTDPFEFGLKMVLMHRDEMYRVNGQSGVDNDSTASSRQQSAEAKKEEKEQADAIYAATGRVVAAFVKTLIEVAAAGRKEKIAVNVSGMARFSKRTTNGHLENAMAVQSMAIESPTLDRALKLDVAKVHLGDVLTADEIDEVEKELEENISSEQFEQSLLTPEEIALSAVERNRSTDDDDDDDTFGE